MKKFKLVLLISCILALNYPMIYVRASTSAVDSIINLISGTWNRDSILYGYTGTIVSFVSSGQSVIDRIAGEDSIIWKSFSNNELNDSAGYKVVYQKSKIRSSYHWMLTNQDNVVRYFSFDNNGFWLFQDAYDGGGYHYYRSTTTNLNASIENPGDVVLWPNPTKDVINIKLSDRVDLLCIYDFTGRVMLKRTQMDAVQQIDVSAFPSGIYTILVISDGKRFVKKVIKQ